MRPLRSLAKTPVFFAVAVLSLGLALGITTTMFGLVDAVVHPGVAYRDPESLFALWPRGGTPKHRPNSYEHFLRLRGERDFHAGMMAVSYQQATVEVPSGSREIAISSVTPEFFSVLGVAPTLGTVFASPDGLTTDENQVVLGERLWSQVRGDRTSPRGMSIRMNGQSYVVTGVMARGFDFPYDASAWVPLPTVFPGRDGPMFMSIWYRAKPGIDSARTKAMLATIAAQANADAHETEHPIWYSRFQMSPRFSRFDPIHVVLAGAVAIVLLIACANLSNLLLARGMARRRELAIRSALGASRSALARLVLEECAVLVSGGALVGVVVAFWGQSVMTAFVPRTLRRMGLVEPQMSWRVFLLGFALALATIVLFGLLPALRASRANPNEAIKDGAGTTSRHGRQRYSMLVMVEVMLSMVLLLGAGLLLRTARDVGTFQYGFDVRPLILAEVYSMFDGRSATSESPSVFFEQLLSRMSAVPEVTIAATEHGAVPVRGNITIQDPGPGPDERYVPGYSAVSPDYFRTLGVRIVVGRDFEAGDVAAGAIIVNQETARRFWPLVSPIGKMIKLAPRDTVRPWYHVVGVARDVHLSRPIDDGAEPPPAIYVVVPRDETTRRTLIARATGSPGSAAIAVRREITALSPAPSVFTRIGRWNDGQMEALATSRFLAALFATFAAFGIAISAIGVYGVVAYAVAQRMREFGVRIALGAEQRDLLELVVHDAAVMLLAGTGVGALIALWASRALRFLAWGVDRVDLAAPLIVAELVLFAAGAIACIGPARRAIRANPLDVLRSN